VSSDSAGQTVKTDPKKKTKNQDWLMYMSLLVGGLMLVADAYTWPHLEKWTARLGIAMIYSATALWIGKGNSSSLIGCAILWAAVLVTIFV